MTLSHLSHEGSAPFAMACGLLVILSLWGMRLDNAAAKGAVIFGASILSFWLFNTIQQEIAVLDIPQSSVLSDIELDSFQLSGAIYIFTLFMTLVVLVPKAVRALSSNVEMYIDVTFILYAVVTCHVLNDKVFMMNDWSKVSLVVSPFLAEFGIVSSIQRVHSSNVIVWYCWSSIHGFDSLIKKESRMELLAITVLTMCVSRFLRVFKGRGGQVLMMVLNAGLAACAAFILSDSVHRLVWNDALQDSNTTGVSTVTWEETEACISHIPLTSADPIVSAQRCTPAAILVLSTSTAVRLVVSTNGFQGRLKLLYSMAQCALALSLGLWVYGGDQVLREIPKPYMVGLLFVLMQGHFQVHTWEFPRTVPMVSHVRQSQDVPTAEGGDLVAQSAFCEVASLDISVHKAVASLEESLRSFQQAKALSSRSHLAESAASTTRLCMLRTALAYKHVLLLEEVETVLGKVTRERDVLRVARDTVRQSTREGPRPVIQDQIEAAVDLCIRATHEASKVRLAARKECDHVAQLHREASLALSWEMRSVPDGPQDALAQCRRELETIHSRVGVMRGLCAPKGMALGGHLARSRFHTAPCVRSFGRSLGTVAGEQATGEGAGARFRGQSAPDPVRASDVNPGRTSDANPGRTSAVEGVEAPREGGKPEEDGNVAPMKNNTSERRPSRVHRLTTQVTPVNTTSHQVIDASMRRKWWSPRIRHSRKHKREVMEAEEEHSIAIAVKGSSVAVSTRKRFRFRMPFKSKLRERKAG